ncbi:MAG: methionyl-tRNA formyltransferase [bacterium]|nr:methionyl-tRNA formyltransferase [bacterium]
MKIVFFGTPDYVLPVLKILYKYHDIVAVVTQPPRPTGRKQILSYSPVDAFAHKHHIPTIYEFEKIPKADLGIVAAYGKIIPEFLIFNFKFLILNIHPSLLPKYRGASPIQAAITGNETQIGATIIRMDSEVDHGPIIAQFKDELMPEDTLETVRKRLFERSAQVLIDLIPKYLKGKIKPREQNHAEATFTKIVKKADGFINLKKDNPLEIERKLRAYTPWPGCWTQLRSSSFAGQVKRIKILKAHLDIKHKQSLALCAQTLVIDMVQLEGKNPVSWKQFKEAYPHLSF